MPLRIEGRHDDVPIIGRKLYNWLNVARLAVFLDFNPEHFADSEGSDAKLAPGLRATARLKACLKLLARIPCDTARPPVGPLDAAEIDRLKAALAAAGLRAPVRLRSAGRSVSADSEL